MGNLPSIALDGDGDGAGAGNNANGPDPQIVEELIVRLEREHLKNLRQPLSFADGTLEDDLDVGGDVGTAEELKEFKQLSQVRVYACFTRGTGMVDTIALHFVLRPCVLEGSATRRCLITRVDQLRFVVDSWIYL